MRASRKGGFAGGQSLPSAISGRNYEGKLLDNDGFVLYDGNSRNCFLFTDREQRQRRAEARLKFTIHSRFVHKKSVDKSA